LSTRAGGAIWEQDPRQGTAGARRVGFAGGGGSASSCYRAVEQSAASTPKRL
jgi:hypothetical protein